VQVTSSRFQEIASGHMRPLSWSFRASFDKAIDPSIAFFTLDVSLLDGTDILPSSESNVVQEWDKYLYNNYDKRVISMEVTREEDEPYSAVQAYADITLNNFDGYFSPNSGSPIGAYILPRRPFRMYMGFNSENLQQIVGLTQEMPEINKADRTASFHVVDFLSYIYDQDISETVTLTDVTTSEVLEHLLQMLGLIPSQYSIDESYNHIAFFYVEKGTKFGYIADKLMEAEIGRLYMDEQGVIYFKNRYSYSNTPVYTFNESNVIDYDIPSDYKIINFVKITSDIRTVQPVQSIWTLSKAERINADETITVWAEFTDPVISVEDPVYSEVEINSSYFSSHSDESGETPYASISLLSMDVFSKSVKMTFKNIGLSPAYITAIELYGEPAKVIDSIRIEEKDQSSIDKFEEQIYEINNEYIQDETDAVSRALMLLADYANYASTLELDVKGTPALQVGDPVSVDLDSYTGVYAVIRINNILSNGRLQQRIRLKKKTIFTLFTLDESVLDGMDRLG
jgi:hypothetical protein